MHMYNGKQLRQNVTKIVPPSTAKFTPNNICRVRNNEYQRIHNMQCTWAFRITLIKSAIISTSEFIICSVRRQYNAIRYNRVCHFPFYSRRRLRNSSLGVFLPTFPLLQALSFHRSPRQRAKKKSLLNSPLPLLYPPLLPTLRYWPRLPPCPAQHTGSSTSHYSQRRETQGVWGRQRQRPPAMMRRTPVFLRPGLLFPSFNFFSCGGTFINVDIRYNSGTQIN